MHLSYDLLILSNVLCKVTHLETTLLYVRGHSNGTSIECGYSIPSLRCPADSEALTKGQKPSKEARKGAMAAAANAARALTSKERKKIFLNRFSNK